MPEQQKQFHLRKIVFTLAVTAFVLGLAFWFRFELLYFLNVFTGGKPPEYEASSAELYREFNRKCSDLSEEELSSDSGLIPCIKDIPCEEAGEMLVEKGFCLEDETTWP